MKIIKLPTQKLYPREIYFSHECYKIQFRKGLEHFGETDPGKKTITIKDGLTPRQLLRTYLHEILHVIEFELPMKIKHSDIYKLEESIAEVIIDNFL